MNFEHQQLSVVRKWISKQVFKKGKQVACPCCEQTVKSYRRKISGSTARALIIISKNIEGEFHLEDTLKNLNLLAECRSDFPKLRYWGLIAQLQGKREDGSSRNGHYRITEAGKMFIRNKHSIQKYMHIYNNEPFKASGEHMYITDCLGEKFSYEELIS
jgi:hypothetical protein